MLRKCIILCLLLILASCSKSRKVEIIIDSNASPSLLFAASELADKLGNIYPETQFTVSKQSRSKGYSIHLLTGIGANEDHNVFILPEPIGGAFTVMHKDREAVIVGFDEFGVLQGVYSMLEKLGYDFQLSHDIIPSSQRQFAFDAWELTDYPLQKERLVFTWHNFLSGCTGWDHDQWKQWILQSAKLGYNTLMIHTYGNNPIHAFEHNGIQKPVGYLATSSHGRDWGTEHVNDVRKLVGGGIFDQAVFGSSAALVVDSMRISAVKTMMQEVFKYADLVGMKINFAFDMDTYSANPQEILRTLPSHALITTSEGYSIANPDTREGYEFYRSQVLALLNDYPQIDRLIGWTRKYNPNPYWMTPLRSLTPKEFPEEWKLEYKELLERSPAMGEDIYAASTFAIGKIFSAYDRILREAGSNTDLGSGSWEFGFLPTASYFYPEQVTLYPLDFKVLFYSDSIRKQLHTVGSERSMIPIVWAHHDDHRYLGKPYTPFESFQDKLAESGASGFGIIHWLTRPLDIYFQSLSRQVWMQTMNEDISSLNSNHSRKIFNEEYALFEEFLNDWILKAPMFGRETSDYFMNPGTFIIGESPTDPDALLRSIDYRIALLKELNSKDLNPTAKKEVVYYLGLEYFYKSFIQQQTLLKQSNLAWMEGRYEEATNLIAESHPEESIELYSNLLQFSGTTRGESAMIISLNLRWYPDFINQKQLAGLEAIRYNFQSTQEDPLAQAPGTFSFFVDEDGEFWRGLGEIEIPNSQAEGNNTTPTKTSDQWISSHKPITLKIQTWRGQPLSPGNYRAIFHFSDSIPGPISLSINGQEELSYSLESGSESPQLNFNFTAHGEAIQLEMDPLGNKILPGSLEIIPQ